MRLSRRTATAKSRGDTPGVVGGVRPGSRPSRSGFAKLRSIANRGFAEPPTLNHRRGCDQALGLLAWVTRRFGMVLGLWLGRRPAASEMGQWT